MTWPNERSQGRRHQSLSGSRARIADLATTRGRCSLTAALALFLTAGATPAASQGLDTLRWHFNVGESLEYVVGFGGVRIGRGLLAVEDYERHHGALAYRVSLSIESGAPFFRFKDHYTSWIATNPIRSLGFEKRIDEGDTRFRRRYELDYQARAYRAEEWDEDLSSYVPLTGPDGSAQIPDPALDEVAFLYLLRLLALEPGTRHHFNSHFEPHGNPVEFRVVGRERVRVPAGRFETVVVDPVLPAMGIFRRGANARLYLTDDDRRLIVKLTTNTRAGTIAFHLRRYTEGAPTETAHRDP